MDYFWIICFCLGIVLTQPTNGQSEFEVQLVVQKYVERGSSVTMQCKHNVRPEILFKVTWLKVDKGKFFEFINGRNPPFRNSTVEGAEIDFEKSNESQVTLKNVDFDASGQYYCEVSTDTPIFTKPSADELLHVFLPQTGPPTIKFRKRTPFMIGERILAMCNTTRARPAPHITWLINGKKVDDKYIRTHHVYSMSGKGSHRKSQQQQQQQQQQLQQQQYYQQQYYKYPHLYPTLIDRYDKSLRNAGGSSNWRDELLAHNHFHDGHHHPSNVFNNPFSSLTNIHDVHEISQRNYDNKHMEAKKHRNSSPNHKYRRHVNEAMNILRSTMMSNNGGLGQLPSNMHNSIGSGSGGVSSLASFSRSLAQYTGTGGIGSGNANSAGTAFHQQQHHLQQQQLQQQGMFSISQLNMEISEHHINSNGRLEITCLATIPSQVGQGEQYADYKTYSVKVEVERQEVSSSTTPPSIGMAALGNGSGSFATSIHVHHIWHPRNLLCSCILLFTTFTMATN